MASHPVLQRLAEHRLGATNPPGTVKLLDYSSYEGVDIPPLVAAAAGVEAVFTRLTMGTSGTDAAGPRRLAGLRGSVVIPGVYHYAHEGDEAAQVAHLAGVLGDATGVLVQYDWELDPATGRPISVSSARRWVAAYRSRFPGHPLLGYLPRWVASQLGFPNVSGLFDLLWASDYSAPYDWSPYCGYEPQILQFTDRDLNGADASWFRGSRTDLAALAHAPLAPDTQGDDMPFSCTSYQLPPHFAFDAEQKLLDRAAVLVLGTPLGGLTGLTRGWLSLSCDFSAENDDGIGAPVPVQSTVRVAMARRTPDGHAAWTVQLVDLDSTTARQVVNLPPGCDKVSVGRLDGADGVGADTPIAITLEMD